MDKAKFKKRYHKTEMDNAKFKKRYHKNMMDTAKLQRLEAENAELQAEKVELNKANKAMAEEYERKMGELLQSLHEVEKEFVSQRAGHQESLAKQIVAKVSG